MIKPKRLQPGDKVAMVSLSWGGIGDPHFYHKYTIAKERLARDFQLELVPMEHSLKGTAFVAQHPELRARDLMDAFLNPEIKAVFCAIGGNDTLRILPYIDFSVLRNNPKIFMGYSDSTINHLMMYHAGVVSFYGPSVMADISEYGRIFPHTEQAMRKFLFEDTEDYLIPSSPEWSRDFIPWGEENMDKVRATVPEEDGYILLQGQGKVQGHLLGGCLDVLPWAMETVLGPSLEAWQGAILFIEVSGEGSTPDGMRQILRNFAAQGLLGHISGIIFGKPKNGEYFKEYAEMLKSVMQEANLEDLPILYNVNFGHAVPNGIIPYGIKAELDAEKLQLRLLESATEE